MQPFVILILGDIGWGIALSLVCTLGVLMTMFRLPGTWLILAVAAAYGLLNGWSRITGTGLLVLLIIAVVAEVLETLMSVLAVKRVGASRKAAIGGLIGGFAGMLLFSIPVPLVGTVIGALLGCFAGAMIGEMLFRQDLNMATKAGLVSAAGFAFGAMLKTAAAIAMSGIILWSALFPDAAIVPPNGTQPETTMPALIPYPDN